MEQVGRVEKIEVNVEGPPETTTLVMNKDLSTPFDCARRKLTEYIFLLLKFKLLSFFFRYI